jgi:small subunit ribosomal protein S11
MAKKATPKLNIRKTKIKQKLPVVRICMRAQFNNSIITLTDLEGKVLAWASSGSSGFKGAKKKTPFAAQKATETILEKIKQLESTNVQIVIKGAGMARDSFLRAIQATDLQLDSIRDATGFPFGGVRPSKRRRV